jgi:hypothetical protein
MQGYSIAGYLNAVMRRTQKTILVEGNSDKSVLQRLKGERCATKSEELPGVIDIASLLTDEKIKGLGMKEIVKTVLTELSASASMSAKAAEKFGTLTDREWDGLTLDLELQNPWFPPQQGCPNFVTVGHSVENYFFRLPPVLAFLRQFFSDDLDQDFFNLLSDRFHAIVGFAVSYSLVMKHIGALTRADRLISTTAIEWVDSLYIAKPALNSCLTARNFHAQVNVYLLVNHGARAYADRFPTTEPGHWLCHGHLGEQAIWACVASLARECGVGNDTATQIERGLNDVRFKHFVDYLCRDNAHPHAPLDSAVEWLTT